ncbi:phage membrane protein [Streptococcus iniae]|nr:hypothetical protein [Streptococcus iniae]AGM99859.1 phage membrane protein [Streptococcus iniae SF1]ASL35753.1 phage membrane protein [Streptococcus iniae]
MRVITKLALVVAISILYIPFSVVALIVYPFLNKEKQYDNKY